MNKVQRKDGVDYDGLTMPEKALHYKTQEQVWARTREHVIGRKHQRPLTYIAKEECQVSHLPLADAIRSI